MVVQYYLLVVSGFNYFLLYQCHVHELVGYFIFYSRLKSFTNQNPWLYFSFSFVLVNALISYFRHNCLKPWFFALWLVGKKPQTQRWFYYFYFYLLFHKSWLFWCFVCQLVAYFVSYSGKYRFCIKYCHHLFCFHCCNLYHQYFSISLINLVVL